MRDKIILVSGAAGSIGSELCRQLKGKIIALDFNETGIFDLCQKIKVEGVIADIRNKERLREVFEKYKPDIVYHAAAYKHLPLMEQFPAEAIQTNIIGTQNLIRASEEYGVEKFVFISTDKAVNPNSIMGATKRIGEMLSQKAGYISVRFGNVLGSRGSVIPIWQRQINENKPITITDEKMERYFMTIKEACSLVIKAGEQGKGGETFILDMGNPVKIKDLAEKIVKETGRDIPIKVIGIRPQEKLTAELMTLEEKGRAVKKGKFWIIR